MSRADYVAAKKELLPLLQTDLTPLVYERFAEMYRQTARFAARQFEEKKRKVDLEAAFAQVLKHVPLWNTAVLQKEVDFITGHNPKTEAAYKALWISSAYVLTSARLGAKLEVRASVPAFREFVHAVYTKTALEFLSDPEIFEQDHSASTLRRNKIDAYGVISNAVPHAIRTLLPVQQLYQDIGQDVSANRYWGTTGPMGEEKTPAAPVTAAAAETQATDEAETPDVVARKAAAHILQLQLETEDEGHLDAEKDEEPMPTPPEGDVELHPEPAEEEEEDEEEKEEEAEQAIPITDAQEEQAPPVRRRRPMPDPDRLPFPSESAVVDFSAPKGSKK